MSLDLIDIIRKVYKKELNKSSKRKEIIKILEKENRILESQRDKLESEVVKLKTELEKLEKINDNSIKYNNNKISTVDTNVKLNKNDTGKEVGQLFMNWCNSSKISMIDRCNMFMEYIRNTNSKYEVRRIFREKNSVGIVLSESAQDAVEYWVVRIRGQNFLLPQPKRNRFNELEGCFEGRVESVKNIKDLYPAEIIKDKNKWVLKSKGLIK